MIPVCQRAALLTAALSVTVSSAIPIVSFANTDDSQYGPAFADQIHYTEVTPELQADLAKTLYDKLLAWIKEHPNSNYTNDNVSIPIKKYHLPVTDENTKALQMVMNILNRIYLSGNSVLCVPYIEGDQSAYNRLSIWVRQNIDFSKEDEYNRKVDEVIASLNLSALSDTDKVRAINQYLVDHCVYDFSKEHYTAYDCLVLGTSVCAGYATAFRSLCEKAGLTCQYVDGYPTADKTLYHAWNRVLVDGVWKCVDPTWNDSTGSNDFLLIDEAVFNQGRIITNIY